jgi:hypothetical protein
MAIVESTPPPEKQAEKKRSPELASAWRGAKERFARAQAWWQHWRKTSACITLIAFGIIYGLLAFGRAPSEALIERSRRAEDTAYLQKFLQAYCAAGGTVLAERPHGGSELYPRGVVMQGELLDAFRLAPLGTTVLVHVTSAGSNPLAGFYGFPPVYVGGTYFHLERPFNFERFRCTYQIRKETAQTGAIVGAHVESVR